MVCKHANFLKIWTTMTTKNHQKNNDNDTNLPSDLLDDLMISVKVVKLVFEVVAVLDVV